MLDDYQIDAIISDRGSVIFYRAFSKSLRKTCILKTLADRDPSPEALASLEHDLRITQKISSDFVIRAHQLTTLADGRMALSREDIGGADLAFFLQENLFAWFLDE